MRTSQRGINLIKRFEGFVDHPYKPVRAERFFTWGYGHYGPDVPNPASGRKITRAQAEVLLRRDLRKFEEGVSKLLKTHVNQNRFDALVSLAYNIGLGNFANSTVLRMVNKRRFRLAAAAFALWVRGAGGVKLAGLVRRRGAEARLFMRRV